MAINIKAGPYLYHLILSPQIYVKLVILVSYLIVYDLMVVVQESFTGMNRLSLMHLRLVQEFRTCAINRLMHCGCVVYNFNVV